MDIRIEKWVYGGEGLARVEGRTVLVPLVLPGERVEARSVEEEPRLVRARLESIIEPAPERIEPGCPYFTRCGGCQYQHAPYELQLQLKAQVLVETIERIGKFKPPAPETVSADPWHYRNRIQLKAENGSGGFQLGYFKMGSHELLPVEKCPISAPRLNALIRQLRELGRRPDFPGGHSEIECVVTEDSGGEDTPVLLTVRGGHWAETLLSAAREIIPGLASVSVGNPNPRPDARPHVFGRGHILYRAADFDFRISHGTFFQTNRYLADRFVDDATAGLGGETAIELFAGAGYFTLRLARLFKRVTAVEAGSTAVRDLESNCNRAGAANVEVRRQAAAEFLQDERKPARPDIVLLDPPRAGLGRDAAGRLARLAAAKVVYVSCDPATLARDAAVLLAAGYRLTRLVMIDLFPQTFHIEAIATLERS